MINSVHNLNSAVTQGVRQAAACDCQPTQATERPAPADSVQLSGPKLDQAEAHKPQYAAGQVLVKFAAGTEMASIESMAEEKGLSVIRHFQIPEVMAKDFGGELFQFGIKNGQTVEEMVAELSGQKDIAYAEPNYLVQVKDGEDGTEPPPTHREPNDLDSRLWGLKNTGQDGGTAGVDVKATAAWATTTGGPKENAPLIAVIDTGIDYNHPDLAANMWTNPGEVADGTDTDGNGYIDDIHGANMITGSGDPMDDNRHGTHCAGTIGAVGNDGNGIVGTAWTANMAGVKFLSGSGGGSYADAIEAVLYSTTIGARVTSNSWGGTGFSEALKEAFEASPALHIAAAGNSGVDADRRPHYPSGFDMDNMISVAAHDRNDNLARFSNFGETSVDVAAPGVDIYSTVPGGGYQSLSGTSMATPHVAGVVSLMLANEPELDNDQIRARLIGTTVKGEAYQGKMVGNGRVSALNVLETDDVPPATPQDFHIADIGATGITVGFTATGDDGMEGQAASYQLRVSDAPINAENFAEANPVPGTPLPGAAGSAESVRIGVAPDEEAQLKYFGLRVLDNMGNASGLVTGAAQTKPATVAFSDDMEVDNDNWTTDGSWGKVEVEGQGKVYTDSPEGAYEPNANSSLTSRAFDLSSVANPVLQFRMKHDTEAGFDRVHVEVTNDGGENWNQLARYEGLSDWADHSLDLSAYEGETVQVRFRMTSDRSVQKDGVYVDDVKVAGDHKATCPDPEPCPEPPPCECPPEEGEQQA